MNIEIVPLQAVDAVWPLVAEKFQVGIDKCGDDLSTGELWQMCRSGTAFLVVTVEEAAILMASVVRFDKWTTGTVLRVLGIAGTRMDEWAEAWESFMENMARDGGADRIVSEGREGYTRIFKRARKLRVVYEMRV